MSGIAHKILGNPEKYSVQELTQGVQSGVIPGYIGIPLIQDKMKKQKEAQAIAGGPQPDQPPIAAQVLAEAQGVPALASNLPEQMAGGGIVAFAGGGSAAKALFADDEEADDDYTDAIMGAMDSMDAMRKHIGALREAGISPSESSGLAALLPPHLGGTNDQSMQVAYNGPGAGIVESVRSYFNKGQENTAPQAAPPATPKTGTPSKFVDAYLPLAEKVGDRLGVAPKLLLAQWGNETGWGKSVIPGTNNLGNIMDFSGKGPKAVDNYNGRVDSYRAYKNPDEFGNDFAGVIERVHKGALNSGEDASRYFGSLKKSGYAEHPKYVDSGIKATKMVERELANRKETNVASMAGGGVARFQSGGFSDIYNMTADQIKDFMNRRLRMEQARAAFSAAPSAAVPAAETAAASSGIGALLSRAAVPLGLGVTAYDIGNKVMDKKQAEELAKYGPEGPPTDEELARAARPAFMRDVSMSPKVQQERGITPLAPLSYTPAGVATYGPRPGYTPPMPSAGAGRGQQGGPTAEQLSQAVAPTGTQMPYMENESLVGPGSIPSYGMDAPQSAAQPAEVNAPANAPVQEDGLAGLRQQIAEGLSGLKNQKEIDNYMALLSGGLGMLGETSPFASANIGRGAKQGIAAYQAAAQARGQDQRGLLSAQLGLERYGQLGALKNEQMALRKDLAAQEDLRKRELAGAAQEGKAAALTERQRIADENVLLKMEQQAEKIVESSGKLASLENITKSAEEIAKIKKRLIDDLLSQNKRYQAINARLYPGIADSFGGAKIRDYDVKTGQLR